MNDNDDAESGVPIDDDREQRYQTLVKLLIWTAEEFRELNHDDIAEKIIEIKDKIAAKTGS